MQDAERLLSDALRLPSAVRATLAGQLLRSLDDEENPPADLEAAWDAEIQQRLADLESGRVRGIPWAEARRQILADELER